MLYRKSILYALILIAVCVYAFGVFSAGSEKKISIRLNLTKPESLIFPFQLVHVGPLGEKGLQIPPNIGRGWRGEAGGSAKYKFFVPVDGKYTLWFRCLWHDVCANAVFVQIDQNDKAILGNDPIYDQWHWVKGFEVELGKGTHMLKLSNHSDHISILDIVLINDPHTKPENAEIVFSDLFYDGFDGCDRGNFDSWEIATGNWRTIDPFLDACGQDNVLTNVNEDENFIFYLGTWEDHKLDVSVNPIEFRNSQSMFSICFAVKNEMNFLRLEFSPEKDEIFKSEFIRKTHGKDKTVAKSSSILRLEEFNNIQINNSNGMVKALVNGKVIIETNITTSNTGGIGLMVYGPAKIYFDDVHVTKEKKNVSY